MSSLKSFLIALPLVAVSGCAGCGVPFNHEIEGLLRISFGDVEATCDASGTRTDDNGTVTFSHVTTGDGCSLGASWEGTLIDTADAKEQVDAELTKQGLAPDDVQITFTAITFEVRSVSIKDAAGGDLTPPSIPSYSGALNVEGEDDLVTIVHEGDGDPKDPTITVKDSQVLLDLVNAAYAAGEEVPATGDTAAVVDMASAADFAAADDAAMEIEYVAKVTANIGL